MAARPRACALVAALTVALVGASPTEALPPPPPHEALDALRDALAVVEALEADVAALWGRQLATRCPDNACRELARAEALGNRAAIRAAARGASEARCSLAYALADAGSCARSRLPGCVDYAPAALAERRAAVAQTSKLLRTKVTHARLSRDRAAP